MERSLRRNESERSGSLARRMLEHLGITRAYVRSLGTREVDVIHVDLPLNYADWKPIQAALVEVERQKGKAITQTRRQQIF